MINKIEKYRYESMPQEKINDLFLEACYSSNLELIEYFLFDKKIENAQLEYKNYLGLFNSCSSSNLNVLHFFLTSKKLTKNPSIDIGKGRLLSIASQKGNLELIEYLLTFENTKRLHLNQNNDEVFRILMSNFSKNQETIKTLVIKYDMKKTQEIIDFLDEKNRGIQEKILVNEWFEKRDLKNVLEYVFEKKEENIKTKKLKI